MRQIDANMLDKFDLLGNMEGQKIPKKYVIKPLTNDVNFSHITTTTTKYPCK